MQIQYDRTCFIGITDTEECSDDKSGGAKSVYVNHRWSLMVRLNFPNDSVITSYHWMQVCNCETSRRICKLDTRYYNDGVERDWTGYCEVDPQPDNEEVRGRRGAPD